MIPRETALVRLSISLVLVAVIGAGVFASPFAEAAQRTVTVTGEGRIEATPDAAIVRIGVESVDRDIQKALASSRSTIEAISTALMALGVAAGDMQTANYSFNFDRSSASEPGSVRGSSGMQPVYRVNNTLTVTIRDLDLTGEIVDAAVLSGANQMWGVEFYVEDPEPLIKEATALAASAAKERAEYLAGLSDLSIGRLLSVSEPAGLLPAYRAESSFSAGVHPGVIAYTVQLTAMYELIE